MRWKSDYVFLLRRLVCDLLSTHQKRWTQVRRFSLPSFPAKYCLPASQSPCARTPVNAIHTIIQKAVLIARVELMNTATARMSTGSSKTQP